MTHIAKEIPTELELSMNALFGEIGAGTNKEVINIFDEMFKDALLHWLEFKSMTGNAIQKHEVDTCHEKLQFYIYMRQVINDMYITFQPNKDNQ